MDTVVRYELEDMIARLRNPDITEDEQIGILADIVVEAFFWQLENKPEKPMEEIQKK